jgi:hypothetical protein
MLLGLCCVHQRVLQLHKTRVEGWRTLLVYKMRECLERQRNGATLPCPRVPMFLLVDFAER